MYGALTLAPFTSLVFLVFKYKADVPFWDDWLFIPFLEKFYAGTLTIVDFWRQEMEHRIFFPRILFLLSAHLSRWDVTWPLWMNVILALGTFTVLHASLRTTGVSQINAMTPILSLVVFSLNQWVSWLLGVNLTAFLNNFVVITGLILLARPVFRWPNFFLAMTLGVVGTYSNANGVLFWPIGLWLLSRAFLENNQTPQKKSMGLWVFFGLSTIASYLYRYQKPVHHPSVWVFRDHPLQFMQFVATYLGAPVVSFSQKGALGMGFIGLVLFVIAGALLMNRRIATFQLRMAHFSIALYFIGTAVLAGIGRSGFGVRKAMTSHYVTMSYPFWTSNLVFVYFLIRDYHLKAKKLPFYSWSLIFGIIVLLYACSSLQGIWGFRSFHRRLSEGRDQLLSWTGHESLKPLTPMSQVELEEKIFILKKHHLSVFRKG